MLLSLQQVVPVLLSLGRAHRYDGCVHDSPLCCISLKFRTKAGCRNPPCFTFSVLNQTQMSSCSVTKLINGMHTPAVMRSYSA